MCLFFMYIYIFIFNTKIIFWYQGNLSNILPESYVMLFQFLEVKVILIIVIFAESFSNIHLQHGHLQSALHFVMIVREDS